MDTGLEIMREREKVNERASMHLNERSAFAFHTNMEYQDFLPHQPTKWQQVVHRVRRLGCLWCQNHPLNQDRESNTGTDKRFHSTENKHLRWVSH